MLLREGGPPLLKDGIQKTKFLPELGTESETQGPIQASTLCTKISLLPTLKGVMIRSMVDALSGLCSPLLKGGNSAFIAAIASGHFPK